MITLLFIAWAAYCLAIIFAGPLYIRLMLKLNLLYRLPDGSSRSIAEFIEPLGLDADKVVIRKTNPATKPNVYIVGIGNNPTIVITDAAYNMYSELELLAMVAHEVGHYEAYHPVKKAFFALLKMFVLLFGISMLANSDSILAVVCNLTFWGAIYSAIAFAASNAYYSYELEADRYVKKTDYAPAMVTALQKLQVWNEIHEQQPKKGWFGNYHPTIKERILKLV